MIHHESSLDEVLSHVLGSIARGGVDSKHAYHFPVLASCIHNEMKLRTVVLRDTDIQARQLVCFTDIRTQKVNDIKENAKVSWLLYDSKEQEQISAKATASLHYKNDICRNYWEKIPVDKRQDYQGPHTPGSKFDHYVNNLPTSDEIETSTDAGFENFCVIVSEIHTIDFLKLMKGGHLRACFQWIDNAWEKHWLAP